MSLESLRMMIFSSYTPLFVVLIGLTTGVSGFEPEWGEEIAFGFGAGSESQFRMSNGYADGLESYRSTPQRSDDDDDRFGEGQKIAGFFDLRFGELLTPGEKIAREAEKLVGSTKWAWQSSYRVGPNKPKCNIFVDDVIWNAGYFPPWRYPLYRSPIGAEEWANPDSAYLKEYKCYRQVKKPRRGDIIAGYGHVGIVTGDKLTTSAAQYVVKTNDWGFRKNQKNIVFWRFDCLKYLFEEDDEPENDDESDK